MAGVNVGVAWEVARRQFYTTAVQDRMTLPLVLVATDRHGNRVGEFEFDGNHETVQRGSDGVVFPPFHMRLADSSGRIEEREFSLRWPVQQLQFDGHNLSCPDHPNQILEEGQTVSAEGTFSFVCTAALEGGAGNCMRSAQWPSRDDMLRDLEQSLP